MTFTKLSVSMLAAFLLSIGISGAFHAVAAQSDVRRQTVSAILSPTLARMRADVERSLKRARPVLDADVDKILGREIDGLLDLYRHLHSNPELSFFEAKTAVRIKQELEKLGFEVTGGIGGHGLVGVMRNGDGPTVMMRTDLDALPIVEKTSVPYASKIKTRDEHGNEVGVMHACGHDVHMTNLVGTARVMAGLKNKWSGTLVVIGQPAEERGAGAKAMLADGLFERFPRPDYALALHVSPAIPAGVVGVCPEFALAAVDSVDVTIFGVGGHGAYPHRCKDPVTIAAELVLSLQTLVSREIDPQQPAVVTVGSIHGGTKHNIIPDEVKMQLTCRSYTDEVRRTILNGIRRKAAAIAKAGGIPDDRMPVVRVLDESIPSTYNDPKLTKRVQGVFTRRLGKSHVIVTPPVMGGEDFGCYGRVDPKIPICIFWLGASAPEALAAAKKEGRSLPALHTAHFAPPPRPTIMTGVRATTAAILDLMPRK